MSPSQKMLREIREAKSKNRQRLGELAAVSELSDEQRTELDSIESAMPDLERRERAALSATEADDQAAAVETRDDQPDSQTRERQELRSRFSIGRALSKGPGGTLDGAEHEFADACGTGNNIPLDVFEHDNGGVEQRATSAAPTSNAGQNLQPLIPAVFAASVAGLLGVEMPRVPSGEYALGRIDTSLTASAKAKGTAIAATSATWTTLKTGVKRAAANLEIDIVDVAGVTAGNFESMLRENLTLTISNLLSILLLRGTGASNQPKGLLPAIGSAPAAPTNVVTWDSALALYVDAIDGIWAPKCEDVRILFGTDSYKALAKLFRDKEIDKSSGAALSLGTESAMAYLSRTTGGVDSTKHMADAASNVQQAVAFRMGSSMKPNRPRTAVMPHYGSIEIADVYTLADKGQRRYVYNVLLGDCLVIHPDAYKRVSIKLA